MQHAGYELPRIPIPRTWVNRPLADVVMLGHRKRDSSPVHYYCYNSIVVMWGKDGDVR
jgi:hypothetical protein